MTKRLHGHVRTRLRTYKAPTAVPLGLEDVVRAARELGELAAAGLLELEELHAVVDLEKSIHERCLARLNAETDSALKEDYGE